MKKIFSLIALSTLSTLAMADSSSDTSTIFASTCYNSSAVYDGKDEACYLFMNPPTYWQDSSKTSVSQWSKADLKLWMQHYIDFQNSQHQFFSQNVPYINGKCSPKPSLNPSVHFDGSNNPNGFPNPAVKVNKVSSLSTYWKTAYDES